MSRHDEIMALAGALSDAENEPGLSYEALGRARAALSAAVAELVRDAERLDWIQSHPEKVKRTKGYLGSHDSWMTRDADGVAHDFSELRPAIDLARAALAPTHHTDKQEGA